MARTAWSLMLGEKCLGRTLFGELCFGNTVGHRLGNIAGHWKTKCVTAGGGTAGSWNTPLGVGVEKHCLELG